MKGNVHNSVKTDFDIQVALSSWSLHTEFLNSNTSGLTADKFPRMARDEFGVKAIEFYEGDYAGDFMAEDVNADYAMRIRSACTAGPDSVKIVCFAASGDLATEDAEERTEAYRRTRKAVEHAIILGCPVVRINTGHKRLDSLSAGRLAKQLRFLAKEFADKPVVFAVENHPHMLRSLQDVELLLGLIQSVKSNQVRLCPDVGAMAAGFWLEALKRLAPQAVHVHLKPIVHDPNGQGTPIAAYGPIVRDLLQRVGFHGAVSLEFTEYRNLNTNPRIATATALREVFEVFDETTQIRIETDTALSEPPQRPRVNQDSEITPSVQILQLLADGCEANLQRDVRIHDFATGKDTFSIRAPHKPESQRKKNDVEKFCSQVENHDLTRARCHEFHRQKLERIRIGTQAAPQICICPMGLMVLSVPVKDDEFLYASISSNAGVELGTEGMTVESIEDFTEPNSELRSKLEQAFLGVPAFTRDKLRASQKLLEHLAGDLAQLYRERRLYKIRLQRGTALINRVRQNGRSLDKFVEELPTFFTEFVDLVGTGRLAHYSRPNIPGEGEQNHWHYECQSRTEPSDFPVDVHLTPPPPSGQQADENQRVVEVFKEHVLAIWQDSRCEVFIAENKDVIIYVEPTGTRRSSQLDSLLDQFAAEVLHILWSLRHVGELEDRERRLEVFVGKAKHSLSGPLQGIQDRLRSLNRCGERWALADATSLTELNQHLNELKDHADSAARIIQRFTGRVRIAGTAELRDQYRFREANPAYLLRRSTERFQYSARKRKIEFRGLHSLEGQWQTECDPDAVAELWDNLVDNAIKFAHDGSIIHCECRPCSTEDSGWKLPTPGLQFVVRDTGLGIPNADIKRIFDPYVQAKIAHTDRVIPGTGLGLAICRHIVVAHQGEIWLESQPSIAERADLIHDCVVKAVVQLPTRRSEQLSLSGVL
jgi:signal transduction histidine kinase/sugar phosphate isomerase/epimerase/ligand-binding sensor protein